MRRTPIRRWATRGGVAAFTALTLATGMQAAVTGVQAATHRPPTTHRSPTVNNPYSPAYHHPYRHGVLPTIQQLAKMRQWAHSHPGQVQAASSNNLNYGGGIDGIGVTDGHEKVYLVFWGSQWGTQSTNSNGDVTLSGDPDGMAPYLQELMKGLGTNNELWSGVMTQYCDGVTTGSQSCPSSNTEHVAYPTNGALAGVWVDESTASPSQATGNQIGTEAVNAAAHFGNTTSSSNRDAQYVIVSPTGTNPDNYQGQGFCAWHDYNGDSSLSGGPVSSPYGDIAFTNLPYIPDAGTSCGMNYVNSGSAGTLDGVSIVEGHEYAETVTDQNPPGGWTDSSGSETGDKCAWISPGTSGGAFNLSLATGSFAMQTTWANDGNNGSGACEASHPIVSNGGGTGNTVTVNNPGNQSGTVGTATSLQITATDSASGQTLTYSASGLPAGLSINSSTGLISGTPSTAGTYSTTVTATDTTGASGSASFTWTIASSGGGGGCTAAQLLGNPGFETGSISPWSSTSGVLNNTSTGEPAQSGSWFAWLDGYGQPHTDRLAQTISIPSNCTSATFSFWVNIQTDDPSGAVYDTLKVQVLNTSGTVLQTLATYSNEDATNGYVQHSFSLDPYIGQTIKLRFVGTETLYGYYTSFLEDTNAVNVS